MQKTFASLMVTILVCFAGMPLAFLAGQRSARQALEREMEARLDRVEREQQQMLATVQRELTSDFDKPSESRKRSAMGDDASDMVSENQDLKYTERGSEPVAVSGRHEQIEPAPIALEQFEALLLGMTYPEAVAAFGREGTLTLDMENEQGARTQHYVWSWENSDGTKGQVIAAFEDGELDDAEYDG